MPTAKLIIKSNILNEITSYFNDFKYEKGGALLLLCNKVVRFIPLKNTSNVYSSYEFSFDELNEKISEDDEFDGIGIIHSHVISRDGTCLDKPSKDDIEFYNNFMKANQGFKRYVFPIVFKNNKGKVDINWKTIN